MAKPNPHLYRFALDTPADAMPGTEAADLEELRCIVSAFHVVLDSLEEAIEDMEETR